MADQNDYFSQFEEAPVESAATPAAKDDYFSQFEETSSEPEYSKTKSALIGAADGASFGFSDELVGAVKAPLGAIKTAISKVTGKEATDEDALAYIKARDEQRTTQKKAFDANPGSYIGGNLAAGVATSLIPGIGAIGAAGKLAQGASIGAAAANAAKAGAIGGLVSGLGASEGSNLGELATDTTIGGIAGGVIGGGIGGGIQSAKKLGSAGVDMVGSFLKRTGVSEDFSRGLEGGQALKTAAEAGVEAAPIDKLKVNRLATPELQEQVLADAGGELQRSLSLGVQEAGDAVSDLRNTPGQTDLTAIRAKVQANLDSALRGGSEVEINEAQDLMKQFLKVTGISRGESEVASTIADSAPEAIGSFNQNSQSKLADFASKEKAIQAGMNDELGGLLSDVANRKEVFKNQSGKIKRTVEEVIKDSNSNRFDDALTKLEAMKSQLAPGEYAYLEKSLMDRFLKVEDTAKSDLVKKGLSKFKKKLNSMGSKQEKLEEVLTTPDVSDEIRDFVAPAIEKAANPTELGFNIANSVDEAGQILSSPKADKLNRNIMNEIGDRLNAEGSQIAQSAEDDLLRTKSLQELTGSDLASEKAALQGQIKSGQVNLKESLISLRESLSTDPSKSMSILDSVKNDIGPEVYSNLKDQIEKFSKITSSRKPVNALDAAQELRGSSSPMAGEVGSQLEAAIPGMKQILDQDQSVRTLVSDLGLNPAVVNKMTQAEFTEKVRNFIATKKNPELNAVIERATMSDSPIAKNLAEGLKKQSDTLGPIFDRLPGKGQNASDAATRETMKLAQGNQSTIRTVLNIGLGAANEIGATIGKNAETRTVDAMSSFINAEGTTLKKLAAGFASSPNKVNQQFARIINSMSDASPDKRKVLLFAMQQNPEYRQMLKDMKEKDSK